MKTASLAALLVLTLSLVSLSHAQEPKAAAAPKVPAFPTADDYTALRMAFAAQPGFNPFCNMDTCLLYTSRCV